jgi:hypothetical protein
LIFVSQSLFCLRAAYLTQWLANQGLDSQKEYFTSLPMHHIIYLSQVSAPLSEDALSRLLEKSRVNNQGRNITGLLLYSERQFMQLLEGEEADVVQLYMDLAQDSRHTGLIKLADKPIMHRSFSEWSMAFEAVSPEKFAQISGYLSLAQVEFATPSFSLTDRALLQRAKAFVCATAA